ncbi:MAG: 4-hydroxy-tetrahydrodipicolinate reductase [Clostridia bacterium]|nr:4-hydroxy-tetrahydrodipicolinate reductase [Clostridia bacterium]
MTGMLLCGCCGRMGKAVTAAVAEDPAIEIAAGVDLAPQGDLPYPVVASPALLTPEQIEKIDVIVDFSNPSALGGLLEFAAAHQLPAVICTTGLNEAQQALLAQAAKKIPVFFSANMSLGVNLIGVLAEKAAKVLGNSFDIEILEMHHNQKVDAPSGTALMLAERINAALDAPRDYAYDRHDRREKRPKAEIGMHAIRGGTITGEHEIIFAGNDEVITISHSARSKALFATGAVNAAKFLVGRAPGSYSMNDLLAD